MKNESTIFHYPDTTFEPLSGVDEGTASWAELVGPNDASHLQSSYVEMENVVIPRQARGEEILFVISGSIRVEEHGTSRIANAGDTIFLAEDAAPTYHVGEKTLIVAALVEKR